MRDKLREKFLEFLGDDLVDTHCHLNDHAYSDNLESTIEMAKESGVEKIIDIAIDLNTSKDSIRLSENYDTVYSAIGIDPEIINPVSSLYIGEIEDMGTWLAEQKSLLSVMIENHNPLMIGECGMDSYWLYKSVIKGDISKSEMDNSLEKQEKLFRMQCQLAEKYELPLSVHSRNLEKKCLEIVNDYNVLAVFHSFTGSYKVANKIIESGHFLGINGIITYEGAEDLRSAYRKILKNVEINSSKDLYINGIVLETDSPWLNPYESRKRNSPSKIKDIYKFIKEGI